VRISDGFDIQKEFARKDERLTVDIAEPIQAISPSAIYSPPAVVVSEPLDVQKAFAQKAELLDLPLTKLREAISAYTIYRSPGGEISEEFSWEDPPAVAHPLVSTRPEYGTTGPLVFATTMIPGAPGYEEHIKRLRESQKIAPPMPSGSAEAVEKNFLDRFFDWFNKILSGK